jgi:hypothetical protein
MKAVIMIDNKPDGRRAAPDLPTSALSGRLLTGRDAAAHILRRLASREWWLFVTCEGHGNRFLGHLEQSYYAGPANKDFEVVLLPAIHEGLGLVGLFLARKSRLPADQLQREFASRVGPITVEELQARDVLVPHPDVRVAGALARYLCVFLARRPGPGEK